MQRNCHRGRNRSGPHPNVKWWPLKRPAPPSFGSVQSLPNWTYGHHGYLSHSNCHLEKWQSFAHRHRRPPLMYDRRPRTGWNRSGTGWLNLAGFYELRSESRTFYYLEVNTSLHVSISFRVCCKTTWYGTIF